MVYPTRSIATRNAPIPATPGRNSTVPVWVARLTLAERTPGTERSAFPTRATHEAHVIPSTGNSVFCTGTSYPVSRIAETRLAILVFSGSAVTVAVFAARLTEARATPSTRDRAFSTRATHEAHVIPSTGKVHLASFPEAPSGGRTEGFRDRSRAAQLITLFSLITA